MKGLRVAVYQAMQMDGHCTVVGQTPEGFKFSAEAPTMALLKEGVGELATQMLKSLVAIRKAKGVK